VHRALDIPLNQGHGPSQNDDAEVRPPVMRGGAIGAFTTFPIAHFFLRFVPQIGEEIASEEV
jgi:hypothetical protein